MYLVLFNPLSKSGKSKKAINRLKKIIEKQKEKYEIMNIIEIEDMPHFLDTIDLETKIVIVGGDGTMHYVANFLQGYDLKHRVYSFRAGTGNDFIRSTGVKDELVLINEHIKNLPHVEFDGIKRYYLNGCGMGFDAYVCKYVNSGNGNNPLQYTKNTIKGFLKYKKQDLLVTIDGIKKEIKSVWFIAVMNGIYQGGGMKFAPNAIRCDDYLDVCIAKKFSRLKMLFLFPFIYFGKHIWFKKGIEVIRCKNIVIECEKENYIQLDGEVVEGIKKVTVSI